MSLILEALRKSEAERRRGETPGLQVELPPPAALRPRRIPPWMIVAAAAAVGLLAALLLLWPRLADDADAVAPVGPEARVAPAPGDPPVPAPVTPAPVGAFARVDRIEPAADVAAAKPPTAAAAAPVAVAPPPPPAAAPATVVDAMPASVEAPAPPAAAAATAPVDRGLRIAGLTAAQRERLPAMKLSLHMWNEDPARRFAVIDGQRRSEGDRVGDATITAIDREGVLLELDGQVVRVPLP